MSLRKSALSGMFWTFIQQISTQGISFIVSIILARLLLPEEFGLIAFLGVFIAIGNVFIDSGLNQSLIRTQNATQEDYSTIFYFNVLLSIIIYLVMYLSAPLIADFYNQPTLVEIVRIYGLVLIIGSFSLIQYTKLTKEMNFKKQMLISLPSLIISSTVSILMAYNDFGVWSLVWGALIKTSAFSIQLWLWSSWRPTFNISKERIKYHLNFGYKITLSALINTFFQEIYTILIGKFFTPAQVGFYNRANTLRQLPVKNISATLNKVTYPLFSKIQDDNVQLKNTNKKIMQMSVFLVAPLLLFMSALSEPLFRFLFTEKWLPAVPYFQILCLSGIVLPISSYNFNILKVKGRSDIFLKLEIVKKTLAVIVIFISFQWGIYGLLYGHLFLSIFGLLINAFYSGRLIDYSVWSQMKHIIPAIVLAGISAIIVTLFDDYFAYYLKLDILRLIIGSLIGVIMFWFLSYLFRLNSLTELKSIILRRKFSI